MKFIPLPPWRGSIRSLLIAATFCTLAVTVAAEPVQPGDTIKLIRKEPLLFREQPLRDGEEGETFAVLAYRPEAKRVFVLLKGKNGKDIAASVPEDAVTVVAKASTKLRERAVSAAKAGKLEDATRLIVEALKASPKDPESLAISRAVITLSAAKEALEMAKRQQAQAAAAAAAKRKNARTADRPNPLFPSDTSNHDRAARILEEAQEIETTGQQSLAEAKDQYQAALIDLTVVGSTDANAVGQVATPLPNSRSLRTDATVSGSTSTNEPVSVSSATSDASAGADDSATTRKELPQSSVNGDAPSKSKEQLPPPPGNGAQPAAAAGIGLLPNCAAFNAIWDAIRKRNVAEERAVALEANARRFQAEVESKQRDLGTEALIKKDEFETNDSFQQRKARAQQERDARLRNEIAEAREAQAGWMHKADESRKEVPAPTTNDRVVIPVFAEPYDADTQTFPKFTLRHVLWGGRDGSNEGFCYSGQLPAMRLPVEKAKEIREASNEGELFISVPASAVKFDIQVRVKLAMAKTSPLASPKTSPLEGAELIDERRTKLSTGDVVKGVAAGLAASLLANAAGASESQAEMNRNYASSAASAARLKGLQVKEIEGHIVTVAVVEKAAALVVGRLDRQSGTVRTLWKAE